MKPTILIVDDEPGVRAALGGVLGDEGYEVEAVATGEACLDRVARSPVDLILLDVWLPGLDGLATFARLRERQVDAQVVVISGHGSIESAVRVSRSTHASPLSTASTRYPSSRSTPDSAVRTPGSSSTMRMLGFKG